MTDEQKKAFAILLRLAIRSNEAYTMDLQAPLLEALLQVEAEVGRQKPEVWVCPPAAGARP